MTYSNPEALAQLAVSLAGQFRIEPLAVPDFPIFIAAAWPLADSITGLKPRLPAGRGFSPAEAMLSAGAEALELRASLAQNHPDFAPGADALPATTIARDLLRGDAVLVPAQHVYLDYAAVHEEVLECDADSTGCATGTTRADAIQRGILECVERDATALWWHGAQQRPALPLSIIDDIQPRLGWWLQERARKTTLIDITVDPAARVVAACSAEEDGTHVAIGFAARFSLAEAVLAASTEMLQTEAALQFAADAGDADALRWLNHASVEQMPQLQPSATSSGLQQPQGNMDGLLRSLAYEDLRALAVDLTLPGDPLPSVRVLVPGYSAMGGRLNAERFERITGRPVNGIAPGALEPF